MHSGLKQVEALNLLYLPLEGIVYYKNQNLWLRLKLRISNFIFMGKVHENYVAFVVCIVNQQNVMSSDNVMIGNGRKVTKVVQA